MTEYMPGGRSGHCVVAIDENSIFLGGGDTDLSFGLRSAYIYRLGLHRLIKNNIPVNVFTYTGGMELLGMAYPTWSREGPFMPVAFMKRTARSTCRRR